MEANNSSSQVHQDLKSVQQRPPYSRRVTIGTPLKYILQTPVVFDSFSEAQRAKLREHVAATVPTMPCAELDQFLFDVFAQDDVLTAYFRPTELYLPVKTGPALKTVLPFEIALAGARRAGAMAVLFPHERRPSDPGRAPASVRDVLCRRPFAALRGVEDRQEPGK